MIEKHVLFSNHFTLFGGLFQGFLVDFWVGVFFVPNLFCKMGYYNIIWEQNKIIFTYILGTIAAVLKSDGYAEKIKVD